MPENTIGEAYLQIKPSMEGISGEISRAMGDEGEKASGSFGTAFASGLKKLGTVALAATTAAATGVSALTKSAVSGFADYQQLVGGVETLFGNEYSSIEEYAAGMGLSLEYAADTWEDYQQRQQTVLENAANAYKTTGMSANEYMETVTSFAASLNSSLGEYAWSSANFAEVAMVSMADNANKMGTPLESIKNAYQGFAKGNFTMLDNLKLGYGGTKEEMERLLRKAEELEGLVEGAYSIDSFADIVAAIETIQDDLGISGTTAKEAGETISGSVASVGAAWQNLIAGFANPDADLGKLIEEFLDAGTIALENLMPTIERALVGIGDAIARVTPIIVERLPGIVSKVLPSLIQTTAQLIKSLANALPEIAKILIQQIPEIIKMIVDTVISLLPELVEMALEIILAISDGIAEALPELIPTIVNVITQIVNTLISNIDLIIDAAVQLIVGLAKGLINSIPILLEKLPIIIIKIVAGLLEGIPKVITAGIEIIGALWEGIKNGISGAFKWGADLISNFVKGIFSGLGKLWDVVKSIAGGIADFLGFSEPEEGPLSNFHTYAPDMMKMFAKGIKDNESLVYDQIADTFNFGGKLGDLGVVAEENRTINLGGTIRLEGVNNQGEFLAASEYAIEEIITNIMKREARLA